MTVRQKPHWDNMYMWWNAAAADRMPAKKLQKNVRILLSVIWAATLY